MDILPVWTKVQKIIEGKIGLTATQTWFSPVKPSIRGVDTLVLEMPDNFFKDWFNQHYLGLVEETLKDIAPTFQISLAVAATIPSDKKSPPITPLVNSTGSPNIEAKPKPAQTAKTPYMNPRYSFNNFVVGPSNRFAHAAALAIVDAPAKAYNPLSIYGGVGLGKTHLMQAICLGIYNKNPKAKIFYTTSERFTNELINAIQHHSTSSFRAKYRNVDILLIDDIQFIAGKESTQEEFFNTFNALYDTHKQIIFSSDRPTKEIPNLQERLVSRFGWGLVTDIQPPDYETRVAILKKKLEREPVKVPDEVVLFIAERVKTNIRELEGALIRVVAYSSLEEKPVSLSLAQEILKDMLRETKKIITIELVQRSVAEFFNLSVSDLKNKKRNKNIVLPRQIAMYLARQLTNLSFPDIGDAFGGKDHTTVLYACNKIKQLINKDTKVLDFINKLTTDIKL
ncbi:MAG TPA: chromosomal replication initiator protein DnaA [Candidatus Omnitrophica bacterium]|nr:chromosomal replication initiator protein DnaA [Candidatus Omnitrophota bacterium]